MVESRFSPEDHLTSLTQAWVGSVLIMGALLFPVLGFMDYFASPPNITRFMIYRLVAAALLMGLYFLNKLRRNRPYQYVMAFTGAAISAVAVELAVVQSGGQSSTYYAAMMILAICCLGFAPVNMTLSFVLVALIYCIYAVPILLTEQITSGAFISNNAFLLAMFVIGLLLRYNNQKLIVSELGLRAELSEDKRKLELYSDGLKDEVAEKSGALAITEQKYRALFDNANDGIAVLNQAGAITDVNQRFCELHGFDRGMVIGTSFRLLEIEKTRGEIDRRMSKILSGESQVYVAEHYRKDGSRIFLEISSRAIDIGGVPHIQSFHRDITEKMKLQEQVLQSQKMESMGVLAGGIAHDFNNMVTAILSHTEVLRRHVKTDEYGNRRIKTIEDAARRAGQLVAKLLSFARKETLELVPTGLNRVVTETLELLEQALIEKNIHARLRLDPDLPPVRGDDVHLEQVIANLVMNAMDAMPGGGTITVSTSRVDLPHDDQRSHPLLPPGKYAVLAVEDTGTGIPQGIRDRIFEPFFTTKPAGKGTGLGLSMVYGIVKSHNGEVRVSSREGKGTTFTIYLPLTEQPAIAGQGTGAALPAASHGERIFVVDDEKDVLFYVKDSLESMGYTVFTADGPEPALELFEKISEEVDVVISDIVMPVMNGAELTRRLKKIKPRVKVIAMSAFEGGNVVGEAGHIDCFLKKPFDGNTLQTCVHRALKAR